MLHWHRILLLCSISTSAAATNAQIKLISAPEFKLLERDRLKLECQFSNFVKDDDHLVWKHKGSILYVDEEELVDDSRYEMTADEEEGGKKIMTTLTLHNVAQRDDGVFECGVESEDGGKFETIRLRVLEEKSSSEKPFVHITPDAWPYVVIEGESVSLRCHPRGNPLPKIHWTRKNGEISSSVKVEDQYLRFPAVRKSDTGIYLCNGVNSVGAANAEVDLRVNDPINADGPDSEPMIRSLRPFQPIRLHETVNISCQYDGQPHPEIEWKFNNHRLSLSRTFVRDRIRQFAHRLESVSETILEISNITEEYFGDYACQASNKHGTAKTIVYVSALPGPAEIKVNRSRVSWKLLSAYDLQELRVYYRAPGEENWNEHLSFSPQESAHSSALTIYERKSKNTWEGSIELHDVLASAKYEIQIQANNALGWGSYAKEHATVIVLDGPVISTISPDAPSSSTSKSKKKPSEAFTRRTSLSTISLALLLSLLFLH